MNTLSGILLAGGKSSRMGQDKGALPFRGTTLLEWQVQKLRSLGIEDVMLSGSRRSVEGTRSIPDVYPNRGPLGGLHACLKAAVYPQCLVLSVDAPLVPPAALAELIRVHRASGREVTLLRHGEKWEPLIGVYQSGLYRAAETVLRSENTAVRRLLDKTGFELVDWPGDEALFLNCNAPEDYERLQTWTES